jgi:uncharacterized membrane protein YgdD (TMEM256/DUF423 family)
MNWFQVGAFFGLTGVILGAFGAHMMKGRLEPNLMNAYQTAVLYQFIHALALLTIARTGIDPKTLNLAGTCFTAGILLFSGSLYALALTGIKVLGAITPLGGLFFIAAWLFLLFA